MNLATQHTQHRQKGLLILMACALVLAGCATPLDITTDYDANYNFSGVRKIAIQPILRTPESAALLSDMQIERIDEALADELTRRGYQVVDQNADADMLLAWHLVTQEKTDIRSYNTAGYYNCWRCAPVADVTVRQYTQGTFIVDLIDPAQMRSKWRATYVSRIGREKDPAKAAAERRKTAAAIFADFPPGYNSTVVP